MSKVLLMRNIGPKKCCLKKNIIFTIEKYASVNERAIMVFSDIIKMYPSTDNSKAVGKVGDKYKE